MKKRTWYLVTISLLIGAICPQIAKADAVLTGAGVSFPGPSEEGGSGRFRQTCSAAGSSNLLGPFAILVSILQTCRQQLRCASSILQKLICAAQPKPLDLTVPTR